MPNSKSNLFLKFLKGKKCITYYLFIDVVMAAALPSLSRTDK